MIRTRIAPSPTGDPHIGTAYAALFNFAFAKKHCGKFILRIEDTDRTRLMPEAESKIAESLKWLGFTWDEGPFHQSERLGLYQKAANELVEKDAAYRCNCSVERLEKLRKEQQAKGLVPRYDGKCRDNPPTGDGPFVVRLKVPKEGGTEFKDLIHGRINFENKDIDDTVLLKSDGWPTYHLAVVVDDHSMKISHVIRAEEWLSSTPKHVLLYEAFGWSIPEFAHLPLLRNPDRSKISKRKNPVSLMWYREQGYLPEAIINYLALMGWSMADGREKFSLQDFVDNFSLERVDPTGPVFDLKKLDWLNGEWIRSLSERELAEKLNVYTSVNPSGVKKVVPLIQERLKKLNEFDSLTNFFFSEPKIGKKLILEAADSEEAAKLKLTKTLNLFHGLDWDLNKLEEETRKLAAESRWKSGDLFMTIRVVVTGSKVSPPLFETLSVIGKKRVLHRLQKAITLLS